MRIKDLKVGQMVSDGSDIYAVKWSEEQKTKYYQHIREQDDDDADNDDIFFVVDADEDYLNNK